MNQKKANRICAKLLGYTTVGDKESGYELFDPGGKK